MQWCPSRVTRYLLLLTFITTTMSQQDNSRASSHASTSLFQDGSDPQRRRSGFILFVYRNRRILGTRDSYEVSKRPSTYDQDQHQSFCQSTILTCRTIFPEIPANHRISFYTTDLDVCDGQMAEIPSTCWTDIVPHIRSISVAAEMVVPEPSPPVPSSKYFIYFIFVITSFTPDQGRMPTYFYTW